MGLDILPDLQRFLDVICFNFLQARDCRLFLSRIGKIDSTFDGHLLQLSLEDILIVGLDDVGSGLRLRNLIEESLNQFSELVSIDKCIKMFLDLGYLLAGTEPELLEEGVQIEVGDSLCHLRAEVRTNGLAEFVKEFRHCLIGGALHKVLNKLGHQLFELIISEDFLNLLNGIAEDELCLLECFVGK